MDHAWLLEVLNYDLSTGLWTWKIKPSKNVAKGALAGNKETKGYWKVTLRRVQYKAHVLAWFYVTGEWPEFQVDHKNGVRDDNRWDNLRKATNAQNGQNKHGPRSDSTTGFLGVSYNKNAKKWGAKIGVNGKQTHLGYFTSPEIAHEAYIEAKKKMHPFFHHLKSQ